ncbi:GNAT family N-acetyltransferase [Streptomyces sp. NPDC001502]|uniref:GNAT family N-acetyltransferase n=1 Tax=Streptomyces sp. NPDC001502 TaxID=3364578 RepID=UPI0036823EB8
MGSAVVRPYQDTDLEGAAAALVAVHATDGYPVEGVADPQAWIRSANVRAAWVGAVDGKIVGHVSVMRPQGEDAVSLWTGQSGDDEQHVAVLARLFVLQEARRRALGAQLMQAATSWAQDQGIRLVLDVMAKDTAAIRLYQRLGWTRIGEATHPYGEGRLMDAICFAAPDA